MEILESIENGTIIEEKDVIKKKVIHGFNVQNMEKGQNDNIGGGGGDLSHQDSTVVNSNQDENNNNNSANGY